MHDTTNLKKRLKTLEEYRVGQNCCPKCGIDWTWQWEENKKATQDAAVVVDKCFMCGYIRVRGNNQ